MEYSVQFSSVAQSCPTLCDPMNRSTPGLPVHHQLPEFTQTHVHRVSDVNNGILLSHKISAFKSVLMRWMNLESIIESEGSQKGKKNHILTYIYMYMESRNIVLMDLFAWQQWRCIHREHTFGHSAGRRR